MYNQTANETGDNMDNSRYCIIHHNSMGHKLTENLTILQCNDATSWTNLLHLQVEENMDLYLI